MLLNSVHVDNTANPYLYQTPNSKRIETHNLRPLHTQPNKHNTLELHFCIVN